MVGAVEQWRSGEVEKWRSGEVEKWRSGEVEKWRSGAEIDVAKRSQIERWRVDLVLGYWTTNEHEWARISPRYTFLHS
jgi:hypothetical protein